MVILYTYNTNRISDGNIIAHTLIKQTEYLMDHIILNTLIYLHIIYTYNTNRIPDGHIILHTLITQTEYLMVMLYYINL